MAFDRLGFWIQNSWGPSWGRAGFGHIGYEDWLTNGNDVRVAGMGGAVDAAAAWGAAHGAGLATSVKSPLELAELRPHVIGIGNAGGFRPGGLLGTDRAAVERLFAKDGDFEQVTRDWPVKRLLLYTHGGLVNEETALQRLSDYRRALLERHVYPVAFVWKTDFWSTLGNALEDAKNQRRPEGFIDAAKNFILDRLDDALEPIARLGPGEIVGLAGESREPRKAAVANSGSVLKLTQVGEASSLRRSRERSLRN